MNINYKQPQFELFPSATPVSDEIGKPRYLLANLTLSSENLVVLGILGIMIMVFFFSLGVERGKVQAARKTETRMLTAVPVTQKTTIVPSVVKLTPSAAVMPQVKTSIPVVRPQTAVQKTIVPGAPAAVKSSAPMAAMPVRSAVSAEPVSTTAAVAPVNPAPVAVSPTVMTGRYTVQIASYKGDKYALQEVAKLKKRGIIAFAVPKGDYSVICVGNFARKEEANILIKKLKRNYKDCLVRRL